MAWPIMGKRCQTAGFGVASQSTHLSGCSCLSMGTSCCQDPGLGKRLVSADAGHLLIFCCCWGSPSVWQIPPVPSPDMDSSPKSLVKATRWHRKMVQRICLPLAWAVSQTWLRKAQGGIQVCTWSALHWRSWEVPEEPCDRHAAGARPPTTIITAAKGQTGNPTLTISYFSLISHSLNYSSA